MFRSLRRTVFSLVVLVLVPALGFAAAPGTPAEAKALATEAVSFLKANGNKAAFQAFDKADGPFVKGDLYVFVLDFTGTILSHGANAKLIGKNLIDLKDPDGKEFVKAFVEAGKKGSGWVDYKWTNPTSKKIEGKTTFCQAEGDAIICCGAYKR